MGYSQPQTRHTVVPLPAEIDITNARQISRDLLAAFAPGVTAVIADMTSTIYCDSSGVGTLALVRQQATANQAKLILVVHYAPVLRKLSLTGLDLLLPVYPSVAEALSAESVPEAGAR
jgi:anti-sigma B factor antagonist